MKIGERVFPYPMLAGTYSDYKNASFAVSSHEAHLVGSTVHFPFELGLRCPPIADLIASGAAEYAIHIECPATAYRELIRQRHPTFLHHVNVGSLREKVERTALVVAARDITGYDGSGEFTEEFTGLRFNIPRGSIMAYAELPPVRVTVPLQRNEGGSSIFVVYKRTETGDVPMAVDINGDRIMLGLGAREYEAYNTMAADKSMQPILNSMLVLPALVYCLDALGDAQTLEDCRDLVWFRTISQSMRAKGMDLEALLRGDVEADLSTVEMAQMVMQDPLPAALAEASRLSFDAAEEDES